MQVQFETVTPIWTGDAWGENSEIKPSSIMGSLRFWFEVYCHFAGIEVKEKEELNYKKFIEKRKENPTQDEFEILQELGLTLPSQIFGCTGWKSRIEIKEITQQITQNYPYPLDRVPFHNLEYYSSWKKRNITPSWYFTKGFFGSGTITFKTTENIKNSILLPLLNFIEQYAFIGVKNNIGYGRVKFTNIDKVGVFEFNKFGIRSINEIIENLEGEIFWEEDKIILIDNFIKSHRDLKQLIKELIEEKSNIRQEIDDQEDRHYKLGTVRKANWEKIEVPQATKIIPLISKNKNGSYSGRFLSIVGIKDFGDKR